MESSKENYFFPNMNKIIFLRHLVHTLTVIFHSTHFLFQTVQWNASGAMSFTKSHLSRQSPAWSGAVFLLAFLRLQ